MTEETKHKISCTLKQKAIRPKVIFDWTGKKHQRPSPRLGEKRPSWIGHKISEAKKGHLVKETTKIKISKTLTGKYLGKKSPNYIQDRSLIKTYDDRRSDTEYKLWRKEIWKLFNYKCYFSSSACKGRLEAHHILDWGNYPELRYEIKNGILLCHVHHPRGRTKEKRLAPYFQMIVTELMPVSK